MKPDPLIDILKSRYRQKKARNDNYSLRSYARHLGIDPSNFSKIVNGKKNLGAKLRTNLARKLGFEPRDIETWLSASTQERTGDSEYAIHPLEIFEVISQWQHYVILELFKLKNFTVTFERVGKVLGISPQMAKQSIQRLRSVGLLVYDERNNTLKPKEESSSSIMTTNTSAAHREQQKQILEGAIKAIDTVPFERRSQSSITMAIDTKKLKIARDLISNFRRDLGRLLSSSQDLDDVYQLSISLYPVTKINSDNNRSFVGEEK